MNRYKIQSSKPYWPDLHLGDMVKLSKHYLDTCGLEEERGLRSMREKRGVVTGFGNWKGIDYINVAFDGDDDIGNWGRENLESINE